MKKIKEIDGQLINAVRDKDLDKIKDLVKRGADVNAFFLNDSIQHAGNQICTILCIACIGSHAGNDNSYKVVEFLLSQGAQVNVQHCESNTCLMYAAYFDAAILQLLLENGGKEIIDRQDAEGRTALMWAANNDEKSVRILCEAGAQVDMQNDKGFTALHYAINNRMGMVRALLEHKADINTPNEAGNTPVLISALSNFRNMTDFLVANGADVSVVNKNGKTAEMIIKEHEEFAQKEKRRGENLDLAL